MDMLLNFRPACAVMCFVYPEPVEGWLFQVKQI